MSQPRANRDCRYPEPIAYGAAGEKSATGLVYLVYLVSLVYPVFLVSSLVRTTGQTR